MYNPKPEIEERETIPSQVNIITKIRTDRH